MLSWMPDVLKYNLVSMHSVFQFDFQMLQGKSKSKFFVLLVILDVECGTIRTSTVLYCPFLPTASRTQTLRLPLRNCHLLDDWLHLFHCLFKIILKKQKGNVICSCCLYPFQISKETFKEDKSWISQICFKYINKAWSGCLPKKWFCFFSPLSNI